VRSAFTTPKAEFFTEAFFLRHYSIAVLGRIISVRFASDYRGEDTFRSPKFLELANFLAHPGTVCAARAA
jgi:hypothetical protein